MIYTRTIVALSMLAMISIAAVAADTSGTPNPPAFNGDEQRTIDADKRLLYAARNCAPQLRQAFDALAAERQGSQAIAPAPCPLISGEPGRASDEGALDILKILKEAAGQGSSSLRAGQ